MTSIKRHKVLYDSSAAGTGEWFRLDSRYEESPSRAIQVFVASGDTLTIQGTTKDVRGSTPTEVLASLEADDIVDIKAYTASEADNLEGPWTYIRVTKTGTTGTGKVQGFI